MKSLVGDEQRLLAAALEARTRAYCPYSGFQVGAAVEMSDGRVFTGANVENAAYPQSVCAERVAIVKAVSERESEAGLLLRRVVVVTEDGSSPCGGCRSMMAQFGSPDTEIVIADLDGNFRRTSLGQFLPDAFEMEWSHRGRAGERKT